MKVAFVLAQVGVGGSERQAQLLVRGLRERDVDVDVYILARTKQSVTIDFGDARTYPLASVAAGTRGARSVVAAARLASLLRRNRYDVVHAVLARAHVIAPLVAPRGVPVVAWRRNMGDHLTGRPLAVSVERLASRRTELIICNATPVAAYWEDVLRREASTIRVIPNGLEQWRFDEVVPAAFELASGEQLLVSVGGLREVKGHSDLIEAAARLRGRHNVVVAILGEGPRREALIDLARQRGVRLVLPGEVADPRPWLRAASVYVHPSLSEGSSNALLEAMAQGCAIVTTRTGDAAMVIGGGGVVVEPGSPTDLAGAVSTLLEDVQSTRRMAGIARGRAANTFSAAAMVHQHLRLYEDLLTNAGSS